MTVHRRLALLAATFGIVVAAAGCSGAPAAGTPDTSATAVPEPSDESSYTDQYFAKLSPRGAIPVKVGERFGVDGPMAVGDAAVQHITIGALRPIDASCPKLESYNRGMNTTPKNGRFLAVDLKVENAPGFEAGNASYYAGSSPSFTFVGADGAAVPQVDSQIAKACVADDSGYFDARQAGRTYTGAVYVDLPAAAGWLILGEAQGTGYEVEVRAAT